jgi:hypothetical protein
MSALPASAIPTESFYVANDRIMAAVCGGQLTTDHVMGLAAFHAPEKDSATLIQSTRTLLFVDGVPAEAMDDEADSAVIERGFVDGTLAVRIRWAREGIEVEDLYFIPPDLDVVVQRIRIRNTSAGPKAVRLVGLLYPQLGSPIPHKKGLCREARFEHEEGFVLVEDLKDNVLVFGFSEAPHTHQVGEVCGHTDVYYDLEDQALSGNDVVCHATPHAALGLDIGSLAPGAEREVTLGLGHGGDAASARALFRRFRAELPAWWPATAARGRAVVARARRVLPAPGTAFGARLDRVAERAALVLRSILRPDGSPMGGIHCYQNVGQVRNGSYILNVLDALGFHDETRGGYEFYLQFRVGDERFSSPDENDQLGTVLHVLRRRLDLAGDLALIVKHRAKILAMADRLVGLVDERMGLIYSERAIHEFVAISRGYETYVNTMAWRGLEDAAELARRMGDAGAGGRYAAAAAALRASVLRHLVHPELGVFVKRLYRGRPYALPAVSMLTPALFGLADANDPVVTRTIAFLMEHNWDKRVGGLYRYPPHLQPWPEHPFGGPWVTYTSWLGNVHLLRGEREQAERCIRWVLDQLPEDSNLIAEHYSVQHIGRRGYGRIYLDPATPEVWATAEFLRLVLRFFGTPC